MGLLPGLGGVVLPLHTGLFSTLSSSYLYPPHTYTPTHPHTHAPTPAAASIGRQESNRVVPEEETLRRNAPHLCGGNQEEVTSGNQEVKVQFVLSCVQVDDIRRAIRDLEGKIRPLNAEPQV